MTMAVEVRLKPLQAFVSMAIRSAPMAFILGENSQQTTPSPRSIRLAPELRSTSRPASLKRLEDDDAFGPSTFFDVPLPISKTVSFLFLIRRIPCGR